MTVWMICPFLVSLILSSTLAEDTVAEDIGVHQLERLTEMLTSSECEDLLFTLSHPEENIFKHLEQLSRDKNQLGLKPRAKRDASAAEDGQAQCRTALSDWLLKYGAQTYYDRLSRALQHIGRTDIAIEVGKNINQDKTLSLKRYVEGYHKYVNSLKVPKIQPDMTDQVHGRQRVRSRRVCDLSLSDLDLIVEQAPVPVYQKGPMAVALPLLYGLLLGFGGTLLVGVSVLLVIVRILHRNPRAPSRPSAKLVIENVTLEDAISEKTNTVPGL